MNVTQCNESEENSICHYCCFQNMCNAGYDFHISIYNKIPKCVLQSQIFQADYLMYGLTNDDPLTFQVGGSLRRRCPMGTYHASNQQEGYFIISWASRAVIHSLSRVCAVIFSNFAFRYLYFFSYFMPPFAPKFLNQANNGKILIKVTF